MLPGYVREGSHDAPVGDHRAGQCRALAPVPPVAYGGLENVVATLIPELRRRGVRVAATVGESELAVDEVVSAFAAGQFDALNRRTTRSAHSRTRTCRPSFVGYVAATSTSCTTIWRSWGRRLLPLSARRSHRRCTRCTGIRSGGGVLPGVRRSRPRLGERVSSTQLAQAPAELQRLSLGAVSLATPILPGPPLPVSEREDHVLVLGRICRLKGQHVAARVAHRTGVPLVLAGPVGRAESLAEVEEIGAEGDDALYWRDEVAPLVDGNHVRWIGSVGGADKAALLRSARALLMPVQWEEPGATVVAEAMAAGTPVVALRRGVLPSLVDHGVTGFIAEDEDGLAEAVGQLAAIDVAACRRTAVERFSPPMAERYLALYDEVRRRAALATPSPVLTA